MLPSSPIQLDQHSLNPTSFASIQWVEQCIAKLQVTVQIKSSYLFLWDVSVEHVLGLTSVKVSLTHSLTHFPNKSPLSYISQMWPLLRLNKPPTHSLTHWSLRDSIFKSVLGILFFLMVTIRQVIGIINPDWDTYMWQTANALRGATGDPSLRLPSTILLT